MPIGHGMPRLVIHTPVMTMANVMTVPTERSIPAVMMTNVTPMARMPTTEVARKMPLKLLHCQEVLVRQRLKKMIRTTRAPSARKSLDGVGAEEPTLARFHVAFCIYALVRSLSSATDSRCVARVMIFSWSASCGGQLVP